MKDATQPEKGPFVDDHLLAKVDVQNEKGTKQVIKTWSRRSTIIPDFIGPRLPSHDGRKHVPVFVSDSMLATSSESLHRPGRSGPHQGRPEEQASMSTETQNPTAKAVARHVRVTPMKARRVVDIVRGKSVDEALAILKFAPQAAAEPSRR